MVGTTVSVKPQSWRVRWGRASDLVVPGKQRETRKGTRTWCALYQCPWTHFLQGGPSSSFPPPPENARVMTGKEGANPLIKSESP